MKVSVIIPCYNSAKTLEASLNSLASQTFRDFEVLIIDGVSKDNTVAIAESVRSQLPSLTIVSEPDKGIYDAMNKGIDKAQGEWLYFLGSDDVLFTEHVLEKVSATIKKTDVAIIYGNVVLKQNQNIYAGAFNLIKLSELNICHQSIFFKKSIFVKYGKYNLKYKLLADWDFNIKLFGANEPHLFINEIIAIYNFDGLSFTTKDIDFSKDHMKIIVKNYPLFLGVLIKYRYTKIVGHIARILIRIYLLSSK